MGNNSWINKPSPKRSATINNHSMKQTNDGNKEFLSPQKRLSFRNTDKTEDINLLSPHPKVKNDKSNTKKNKSKISISTYDNAMDTDTYNTPQTQKHKCNKSMMSSISICSHSTNTKLFSPSNQNTKSNKSLSTATPRRFHSYSTKHGRGRERERDSSSINEIIVASRFKLIKKIGKGSFGVAYESIDLLTNDKIAIKLERKREDRKHSQSKAVNTREIIILEKLENCSRVPSLIWHGEYKHYRVIGLQLQGMNLSDLYEICDHNFSLQTIIYIFIECIKCLQDIHSKGIVHRDIKPQNFI
eukprot:204746_1